MMFPPVSLPVMADPFVTAEGNLTLEVDKCDIFRRNLSVTLKRRSDENHGRWRWAPPITLVHL